MSVSEITDCEERLQALGEAHANRLRERDQLELAVRQLLGAIDGHRPAGDLHDGLDPGRCPLCLAIAGARLALTMIEPAGARIETTQGRVSGHLT